MSVPVDVDGDLKEISELKDFLQYQSTLSWLKQGDKEQQRPPVDVMGGLCQIANSVQNKKYKSDYEVQIDIRQLLDCELQLCLIISKIAKYS